jgi:hypothetical protein
MLGRPQSEAGAAFDSIARGVAGALGWQHIAEDSTR